MNCHVTQTQLPCNSQPESRIKRCRGSKWCHRAWLPGFVFMIMGLLATETATVWAAGAGRIDDAWSLCPRHIRAAEQQHDLPAHLLTAISKVESGLWDAETKANLAWPWTVMAEGKGRYLPSKTAALAEVRKLQARGIKNIDVGCMQINLYYHPDAFQNLEQAFDPKHNTAYAASLLRNLRRNAGSWTHAIGDYHSKTIAFARVYRLKVFKAWRAERHAENRRLRDIQAAQKAERKRQRILEQQASAQASTESRRITPSSTASSSAGIWR